MCSSKVMCYKVWKEFHRLMKDHCQLSLKRLHRLLHRLRQDPEILSEHDFIIQGQVQHGIVQKMSDSKEPQGLIHYLPHLSVVHHDKNITKVRFVYDASAKVAGPSLNDCLLAQSLTNASCTFP